ncbi:uncharacterized protein BDZ99DRAFT_459331 [Mytilinidion resinicola]|uniref:3'-phosphate/5'-hydroxy nucleic acid ligase n=1 Tax=Mytilinidion resinicola TaxID=574789 RepID=A0A6A6Z4A5_9PEZI|nr:uncharacterized protein BDZ99DRAFT_459331 [Mytilinidion resinicola]KAF2815483.1 hypothetical protein BDZ99DRAFT_459331 [Mytilinidion resinicola]
MPPTRLTLALNASQTKRTPVILPPNAPRDPALPNSCQELLFKAAKDKLRLKGKTAKWRIFVARNGLEVLGKEGWESALAEAETKEIVLLISAGEDYVGKTASASSSVPKGNADCTVEVLAKAAFVDSVSLDQLNTTARSLPGLVHAVGQPDLHPGTKFPIGAVFVSRGWVHPPLIGGDIGCGMAWYRTRLQRHQVEGDRGRKVAERLRRLEGAWRDKEQREAWLNWEKESTAGEEWDKALGTIGAGNHFAEIQVVEECEASGNLEEGEVILLVHSGSRGYGGHVLKTFTGDGESLEEGTEKMEEYMQMHDSACRWAKANRDLIALRFLACLEPGEESWVLGRNENDSVNDDDITVARANIQERKVVDIWHNNVEKIQWPPSPPSPSSSPEPLPTPSHAYIHRKGAAPTYNASTRTPLPLPLLPLPGSRATPTLILRPLFTPANAWGAKNALSLAHGAGRAMSRHKALVSLSQKYKNPELLLQPSAASEARSNKTAGEGQWAAGKEVNGGTWVVCEDRELVWEEAPEAYKDVWEVGEDLVDSGVAEILGWCRARVCYKVRDEGKS